MRRLFGVAALGFLVACGKTTADDSSIGIDGSAGQAGTASMSTGVGGSAGSDGIGGTGGAPSDASAVVEAGMVADGRPGVECNSLSYDSTALRRLNNWEYQRTVFALTGLPTMASLLEDSLVVAPFVLSGVITPVLLQAVFFEAERQARALGDTAVGGCQGKPSATCGKTWVTDFVRQAFRRPLTDVENLRYGALFDAGAAAMDMALGVSLAATAALISPNFLYQIRLGEPAPGDAASLTQFEIASKLSYFLTGGPPDHLLDEAARAGKLGSRAERTSQAGRLFESSSFIDVMRRFHGQWLGLDGLSSVPGLTQAQADSMRAETLKFIDYVFKQGGHKVSTLLTAPIGFVDANLASIYGVPDSSGQETRFNPLERAGVLTLASTLALHRNPTQRGLFVRERLICEPIPPPPPNIDPQVTIQPGQTRREAWMQAMTGVCAGCHNLIDTLGYGFEHYDDIGAYRTTDNGHPVDAHGEIVSVPNLQGSFDGAIELASKLSGSRVVFECLARQWISVLNQRAFDEQIDSCPLSVALGALDVSGGDLNQMLIAVASDPSFPKRRALPRVSPGGSPPAVGNVATEAMRRKELLDFTLYELRNLTDQVPVEERIVVDAHVQAARELQVLFARQ
jgi:hypothetical protein